PEIKSGEYKMKAQEKRVAYYRGARVPELYLSGLYYSRYLMNATNPLDPNRENPSLAYPLTDQIVDNRYAQLSVGLSIPIFTRMNTQTNISKSKIELDDYRLALKQDKQVLYKTIQQAHSNAISALERYNSAREAVTFNEEAFNYTTEKFEVGLVNSVDFNVAKNNLAKARSDLAQAKYEYIFRMKILDFYQGKPIHL
ncbi:MAG TPA: TolC family protein, partial [Bacteroidales bacterium]|nr:TolC family protein [Bacteroidales bacterium]